MPTTYVLTTAEAAGALRTTETDADMLALLPMVDAYLQRATGRNWAADTSIAPEAKHAARIVLVCLHEDPGQFANGMAGPGLAGALTQLEALAGRLLTFWGVTGGGYCALPGAEVGDVVAGVVEISPTPGDAHTLFESVITYADCIMQVSASNLGLKKYRVRLTSAAVP